MISATSSGPAFRIASSTLAQKPAAERHIVMAVGRSKGVGVRNVGDVDCGRSEGSLEPLNTGERERAEGDPVVGDVASYRLVPLGLSDCVKVLSGDFPGRFDRFRSPAGEEAVP